MTLKINLEKIILVAILVLGFGVRLYKLDSPIADWHSWRQADTASVSKIFLQNGVNLLVPRYHDISSIQTRLKNPEGYRMVEFPLFNAIQATLAKNFIFLSIDSWGRMTSILFSIGSAYILYLLGNKHLGRYGGLLAAFFFLFIPYNIFYSRVVLPEQMGMFFALLGLYLFDLNIILSAVVFSVALLVKPFFAFYLLPIFISVYKNEIKYKDVFKFLFISFLPFLLWRIWISKFPEGIPLFEWMFNGDRIRLHPSFFRWIFYERLTKLILGFSGLIIFLLGVYKNKSEFVKNLLVGILLYVVIVATANVKHDYYQILTIPPIALALAVGIKNLNKFISIVLVLSMLYFGWGQVKGYYLINHPEIFEAGKAVSDVSKIDDLVLAPYNGDTAFLYATGRSGWPAVDDSIDNIIERGAKYYVSVDLSSADTLNFSKRFKTINKTDKYIILDLRQEIKQK